MIKRFFLSVAFMLFGIFIYLLYYIEVLTKNNIVFSIIRNFLPDMCWTFSFFFISIIFIKNLTTKPLIVNSIYVFGIALCFEILQKYNIVGGTFDILDIFVYGISTILACFIENRLRRNLNEKKT